MKCRPWNILCALSLLLALTSLALRLGLWRATFLYPLSEDVHTRTSVSISTFPAMLSIRVAYPPPRDWAAAIADPLYARDGARNWNEQSRPIPGLVVNQYSTFWSRPSRKRELYRTMTDVDIRYWLLIVLSAVVPLSFAIKHILHRFFQPRPGSCSACGYDLRATPDRCPECGLTAHQ